MLEPDSVILNNCSYTNSLVVYLKVTHKMNAIL